MSMFRKYNGYFDYVENDTMNMLYEMLDPYSKLNIDSTIKRQKAREYYESLSPIEQCCYNIDAVEHKLNELHKKEVHELENIYFYQRIIESHVDYCFDCSDSNVYKLKLGYTHSAVIIEKNSHFKICIDLFKNKGLHRVFKERIITNKKTLEDYIKQWREKLQVTQERITDCKIELSKLNWRFDYMTRKDKDDE